jgi:alkanesulfonate monooxygenase SsuD/methylene tetrahydromethanopterin reductase-like flavin-dependent oxidoreductase (luciferase family)
MIKYGLDVTIAEEYCHPRILAELATEAEQAGWDGFFVQDFIYCDDAPIVDPWIALAAIAMQTSRIRIGAFMTALPRRRPWKVARETVSLDHLSNGRLIFGAGLGFQREDFWAFGETDEAKVRAEKLDESLTILSGLWTGEPIDFAGEHYQIKGVRFLPKPMQTPRIPVWIAGGWPNRRPFRRAARWDGVYVMTNKVNGEEATPNDIREMIEYIQAHRDNSEPFEVAFAGETSCVPQESAEVVGPYTEAGVTWWLEGIWEPLAETRKRIGSGPPKV